MQPDTMSRQQKAPLSNLFPQAGEGLSGLYAELMRHAAGLPNDELFAQMIASQVDGASALPPGLGLDKDNFSSLLARHFSGFELNTRFNGELADQRELERDDVYGLLLEHRAQQEPSEQWMAAIVTAACMANDHLWQDLGLWSRDFLSRLMQQNFPTLAAKNIHNMKWKKFLYKQLCEKEDINTCRAPSCAVCADYQKCFGSEE
jgi:nitrogen fixation protein NifQ